jgi:hypothetical protein
VAIGCLPSGERGARLFKRAKGLPGPELLAVDPVAAFDLAVLLGSAWSDVAVLDASGLEGQREVERELRAVVGSELADREGKGDP